MESVSNDVASIAPILPALEIEKGKALLVEDVVLIDGATQCKICLDNEEVTGFEYPGVVRYMEAKSHFGVSIDPILIDLQIESGKQI